MPERTHRQPLEPQRRATARVEEPADRAPALNSSLTPEQVLRLQGAAGNHAVARLAAGKLGYGVPEEETAAGAGKAEREETAPKARLRLVRVARARGSGADTDSGGGLGFKKFAGPTTTDCGGYTWSIQWVLDKPSPKGGWIVQGVTSTFDVKDAAGKAVDLKKLTGGKVDPATWTPYWEAWQVNAGKDVTTYAEKGDRKDDTYWMSGFYDTTKGSIKMAGKAEFYEGLKLPADFKVTNTAPAWILPMTRTKPTLAGGTGMIDHNLTAKWDCTAGSKSKATTVTTTPPTTT